MTPSSTIVPVSPALETSLAEMPLPVGCKTPQWAVGCAKQPHVHAVNIGSDVPDSQVTSVSSSRQATEAPVHGAASSGRAASSLAPPPLNEHANTKEPTTPELTIRRFH